MINNHCIRFIVEAHTSISQPVVKFKRGICLVLLAKICHNPGQLYLTPPSSPSGLSSDVNGRLGATKLSNAARPRHFCLFSTSAKSPQKQQSEKSRLTSRGTSLCKHRTRSWTGSRRKVICRCNILVQSPCSIHNYVGINWGGGGRGLQEEQRPAFNMIRYNLPQKKKKPGADPPFTWT